MNSNVKSNINYNFNNGYFNINTSPNNYAGGVNNFKQEQAQEYNGNTNNLINYNPNLNPNYNNHNHPNNSNTTTNVNLPKKTSISRKLSLENENNDNFSSHNLNPQNDVTSDDESKSNSKITNPNMYVDDNIMANLIKKVGEDNINNLNRNINNYNILLKFDSNNNIEVGYNEEPLNLIEEAKNLDIKEKGNEYDNDEENEEVENIKEDSNSDDKTENFTDIEILAENHQEK